MIVKKIQGKGEISHYTIPAQGFKMVSDTIPGHCLVLITQPSFQSILFNYLRKKFGTIVGLIKYKFVTRNKLPRVIKPHCPSENESISSFSVGLK